MKKMTRILAAVIVLVTLASVLASCAAKPNADPAAAVKALEQNYYQILSNDTEALPAEYAKLGVADVTCVVVAKRVEENKKGEQQAESVTILYFKDDAAAKAALSRATDLLNIESSDSIGSKYIVKQSGSMIYAGTKNAIKAAK